MNYPTDPYEAGHAQGERTGRSDAIHEMSQPVGTLVSWCEMHHDGLVTAEAAMVEVAKAVEQLQAIRIIRTDLIPDEETTTHD